MKIWKALLNLVIPSLTFYAAYKLWGIIPAVAVSMFFCIFSISVSAVRGKIKNTQILGMLGLLASAAAIHFTGNEKYYYIPSLIENIVWMVFFSLKIIVKIAGIVCLNFETLYWLVFIMGDPMTIAAVVLSVVLIRRSLTVEEE